MSKCHFVGNHMLRLNYYFQVEELNTQVGNLTELFEESQEQIENLEFMVLEAQAQHVSIEKVGQITLNKEMRLDSVHEDLS